MYCDLMIFDRCGVNKVNFKTVQRALKAICPLSVSYNSFIPVVRFINWDISIFFKVSNFVINYVKMSATA